MRLSHWSGESLGESAAAEAWLEVWAEPEAICGGRFPGMQVQAAVI